MNYGYTNGQTLALEPDDEPERYSIQLYHHTVSEIDLTGQQVLEVGCGRGGGASYITRYLGPAEYVGLDQSKSSIEFCSQFYQMPEIRFVRGDAEDLSFEDGRFDAIVNVESSRCYGHMDRFLAEVHRVLRPGGHLLFTDLRVSEDIEKLREQFRASGLKMLQERNITANVVSAMEMDNDRRQRLIEENAPRFMQPSLKYFAGIRGTERYESFASGQLQYLSYILQRTV